MGGLAEFELVEGDDGKTVLTLSGPYLVSSVGAIDQDLRALEGPIERIDLSDVSEIDTVGAWLACSVASHHDAEITGASDRAEVKFDNINRKGSYSSMGAYGQSKLAQV